jgi:putative addiction module component (TIGR02574 family)
MARHALDISTMTPEERLELIGELWDSLDDDTSELSNEQRSELQRRMADVDARGPTGVSWAEVKAKLMDSSG